MCSEVDFGALRRPIGNEVLLLWEWLPATIPSRQDAAPTGKNPGTAPFHLAIE
jgi:hypothetical protein